jgi:hypothetical protein
LAGGDRPAQLDYGPRPASVVVPARRYCATCGFRRSRYGAISRRSCTVLRVTSSGRFVSFTQARPNGGSRRISPVAECPDQGPLTEPAADAPPRGWGLLFMPLKRPCRRDRGTPRSHGFGSFPVRVAAGASAREAAVRTGRTANGSADLGFPGMKFCPVYRECASLLTITSAWFRQASKAEWSGSPSSRARF